MSKVKVDEMATILFVKALAERLGDDQGVVVHHDDRGFIVYKNVINKTMGIQEDERFLTEYNNGDLVSTGVSKSMAEMLVQPDEEVVSQEPCDPKKLAKN